MLHSDKEHFRELVSLFATTLDAVLHKSNPHQVCVHVCVRMYMCVYMKCALVRLVLWL